MHAEQLHDRESAGSLKDRPGSPMVRAALEYVDKGTGIAVTVVYNLSKLWRSAFVRSSIQ